MTKNERKNKNRSLPILVGSKFYVIRNLLFLRPFLINIYTCYIQQSLYKETQVLIS